MTTLDTTDIAPGVSLNSVLAGHVPDHELKDASSYEPADDKSSAVNPLSRSQGRSSLINLAAQYQQVEFQRKQTTKAAARALLEDALANPWDRLAAQMYLLGVTPRQLCNRTGLRRSRIEKIMRKKLFPTSSEVLTINEFFSAHYNAHYTLY